MRIGCVLRQRFDCAILRPILVDMILTQLALLENDELTCHIQVQ